MTSQYQSTLISATSNLKAQVCLKTAPSELEVTVPTVAQLSQGWEGSIAPPHQNGSFLFALLGEGVTEITTVV